MKNLSEDIMKRLADSSTIAKAKKFCSNGSVKKIEIDPFFGEAENGESIFKVNGEVFDKEGFIFQNTYTPSFIYMMDNEHIKLGNFSCNCSKFNEVRFNKRACSHLGAIIKFTIDSFIENSDKDKEALKSLNIFVKEAPSIDIDKLIKLIPEDVEKSRLIPLELEVMFEHNFSSFRGNSMKVNFSIGIRGERKYKISNIPNFIDALVKDEPFKFGKNFTYDKNIHYFDEDDEKILDYLIGMYFSINNSISGYYINRWSDIHSNNALDLKKENLIRFLELFKDKRIGLELRGQILNPQIKFCDLPINFIVDKEQNGYSISLKEGVLSLDNSDRVFFCEGHVYIISSKKSKIFKAFASFMEEKKPYFRVSNEDKAKFLNKVLPEMNSNFNIVTNNMDDEIVKEALIIKAYLDKNESGDIEVKIQYSYGDYEINPLSKKNLNIFLLRDVSSEKSIETELCSLGFIPCEKSERYVLSNISKIYTFLDYGLPSLLKKGEVFYSEDFKKIRLYRNVKISSYVKLNDRNLIDIDFALEDISNDEIYDILSSLKENKKYHRLKDGSILNIQNDEIKEFSNLMDSLDVEFKDLNKGKVALSKAKAFYLENRIEDSNINFVQRGDTFNKFLEDVKTLKSKEFDISLQMKEILRNYQEIGYKWMCAMHFVSLGGVLADEMGLGKTIQSIAFMESCKKVENPFLIICPSSLIYNWKSEIEKFSKELTSLIVDGTKAKRKQLLDNIKDYDVIITSYPLMRNDYEIYQKFDFNSIIIDEAQNIKNHHSQNAFSVKNLNSKSKFALTGTPLENSLGELWSIFDFILPSYLGKYANFKNKYEIPIITNKAEGLLKDLISKITPFVLRRLKKDVLLELPPKIETNFIVDLSKDQKKLYISYVKKIKEDIDDTIEKVGIKKSQIKILAGLTRLRQLCCDPSTFIEDYKGDNNKMDALIELIEDNIESKHKILIFSQFTSVLKNISKILLKNKVSHKYLDGSTKPEERLKLVEDFNSGSDMVFLISLKAGGVGLNLIGADVVIHYDPWWNPSVENQATDRAHRIGQENVVQVMKIIAKNTIEEKILKLQEKKREMIENVLDSSLIEGKMLSSLSEEELKDLFTL